VNLDHRIFYMPYDPKYHVDAPSDVTVIGVKQGEIGYWPIYTPASVEDLNGEPVNPELVMSATTASMWGWHRTELTKPILDWMDKKYGELP
jgi:hypothetical protein